MPNTDPTPNNGSDMPNPFTQVELDELSNTEARVVESFSLPHILGVLDAIGKISYADIQKAKISRAAEAKKQVDRDGYLRLDGLHPGDVLTIDLGNDPLPKKAPGMLKSLGTTAVEKSKLKVKKALGSPSDVKVQVPKAVKEFGRSMSELAAPFKSEPIDDRLRRTIYTHVIGSDKIAEQIKVNLEFDLISHPPSMLPRPQSQFKIIGSRNPNKKDDILAGEQSTHMGALEQGNRLVLDMLGDTGAYANDLKATFERSPIDQVTLNGLPLFDTRS
jgi:hypothetical protein